MDAILADEVKFLNHEQYLEEVVPANRGNDNIFGHLAEHHMVTMFTDMPTKQQAKWILEKAQQVDMEKVATVITLQVEYNKMLAEYQNPITSQPRKQYLYRKLTNYYLALNELRIGDINDKGERENGLLWYSEASTLENIQILGEKKFHQWMRELKQHTFDTSILNLKNLQIEDGFFYLLDTEYHGYESYDYDHIDQLGVYLPKGVMQDCRKDGDLIKNKPLDIALDYNAAIKSLVIGQDSHKHYRTVKSMFVLADEKKVLDDLIDEFCEYYKPYPCKEIHYYYDHTALVTDASRLETFADIVSKRLIDKGWVVYRHYIGQAPRHDTRYRLWEMVMKERDRRFKPVRFNLSNAESLITSMQQTQVRQGSKGFEKNKTTEKRKSVRPQDAPHLGDAWETLYIGRFKEEYGYADMEMDLIIA
jgi:hypothetical protein